VRVLAQLNNQFSTWRQQHSPNINIQYQDQTSNVINSFARQAIIENSIEELDETPEISVQPASSKFKSKLPFSPKSYRKNQLDC